MAFDVPKIVAEPDQPARIGDRAGIEQYRPGDEVRPVCCQRHDDLATITLADKDAAIKGECGDDLDQVGGIDG